jgi:receptor expression-enhancing protein 1/2/3/4
MLSSVADLLTLLSTTLFPLFASYKALKSPTPVALAPWLTFYATVSVVFLLESTILFPLQYVPFYAWFRLFFHAYLLFPAPEGATRIYHLYIEPFLAEHETDIEDFITTAHDRGKAAGLQYLKQAIDWIRVNVLGQEPTPPQSQQPPAASYTSYAQQLLSRFYGSAPPAASSSSTAAYAGTSAPGAIAGSAIYSAELFGTIASALQSARNGRAGDTTARNLAESGNLIPPQYSGSSADRVKYAKQARESLTVLMKAFEREENDAERDDTISLSKSRSETEFDKIEREEVSPERAAKMAARRSSSSGGWMPWSWGGKPDDSGKKDEGDDSVADIPAEGKSSGIDLGH